MEPLSTRIRRLATPEDGSKSGDSTSVGLFIPLPTELAKQFPKKNQDKSPPHVTFLFVGEVPSDRQQEFVEICQKALKGVGTVPANLAKLEEFVNPKGQKIPHMEIGFGRDMAAVRRRLRRELMDAGFTVGDSFLQYKPHSTLEYMDDAEAEYDGPVPEGSFDVDVIEVWGLPQVKRISLASTQIRRLANS